MKYPIDSCPYCGDTVIKVTQRISGYGEFYDSLIEKQVDNSSLHDYLRYKTINKYAYCANCGKRLFELTREMDLY